MLYTIGEMAKIMNVAPSTLRYYDKEGLLPYVERSRGGIRMFKDEDRSWLAVLECLKKTGMPIKEIKRFMEWCVQGDQTIGQRLELIEHQRQAVQDQIAQLQETLHMLDYKCWYYRTARDAGTCSVHDTMAPEDIPPEFRALVESWRQKEG